MDESLHYYVIITLPCLTWSGVVQRSWYLKHCDSFGPLFYARPATAAEALAYMKINKQLRG